MIIIIIIIIILQEHQRIRLAPHRFSELLFIRSIGLPL